jgi:hypothetical protein
MEPALQSRFWRFTNAGRLHAVVPCGHRFINGCAKCPASFLHIGGLFKRSLKNCLVVRDGTMVWFDRRYSQSCFCMPGAAHQLLTSGI